jgi:hypothetical protein
LTHGIVPRLREVVGSRYGSVVHLLTELINIASSLLCRSLHFGVSDYQPQSPQDVVALTHLPVPSDRGLELFAWRLEPA